MIEYKINDEGKLVKLEKNNDNIVNDNSYNTAYKGFSGYKENSVEEVVEEKKSLWERMRTAPGVKFKVNLSPYEKKVFSEVKNFWTKDLFNFK